MKPFESHGVPDMLSYGASAFVRSDTGDILDDLLDVYAIKDAYTIMAIATLRIIKPSVVNSRLSSEYNAPLSAKTTPVSGYRRIRSSLFCSILARTEQNAACSIKGVP